ncbi:unnamed protein product [Pieris brassicae]|uniref:Uncharacterized protein n=1 Tax=Pieris brassicae TaxID=7116 RepID=A0A9P0U1K2_PIEBR|nr:unnamed protein product [Pieris brassicae]
MLELSKVCSTGRGAVRASAVDEPGGRGQHGACYGARGASPRIALLLAHTYGRAARSLMRHTAIEDDACSIHSERHFPRAM